MLNQKFQRILSKVALFALIFASLAPSISHALAAGSNSSFTQFICSSDGNKFTVKQIMVDVSTVSDKKSDSFDTEKPIYPQSDIHKHQDQCPFCGNPAFYADLTNPAWFVIKLEAQAKAEAIQHVAVYVGPQYLIPPAQAPPHH